MAPITGFRPYARIMLVALFVLLTGDLRMAAMELGNGNLRLQLGGALAQHDLELEIPIRDGRVQGDCWGSSLGYNRGRHVGRVERLEADQGSLALRIDLQIGSDPWMPGGRMEIRLALGRAEVEDAQAVRRKTYTGTYAGSVRFAEKSDWVLPRRPWQGRPSVALTGEPEAVEGVVTAVQLPVWPQALADHVPLAVGEHPRLALRGPEVVALRRRLQDDERAQAMLARLHQLVDQGLETRDKTDKFSTWPAVGHGLLYQLTGDVAHAERAWTITEQTILANPKGALGQKIRQDIHHAPRLVGLALVYDLCHAAWHPTRRIRAATDIAQRTRECVYAAWDGKVMGGTNFATWSNHNGIRMGAVALGALVLLGLEHDGQAVLPEAMDLATDAARQLREFSELGVGGGGTHLEGMFYKYMTVHRGYGQAINAFRHCLGWDIVADTPGASLTLGDLLRGEPGELLPRIETWDGYGSPVADFTSVSDLALLWHLPTVPPAQRAGVVQLIHRHLGAEGNGTYGVNNTMAALYAFANYPFDEPGVAPGSVFPWLLPDPAKGHYVIRPVYENSDDILLQTNMRAGCFNACHYERSGPVSMLRLQAFGDIFLDGRYLALPEGHVWPGDGSDSGMAGPEITRQQILGRRLVLDMDLSHAFLTPMKVKRGERADAKAESLRGRHLRLLHYGDFADHGWRGWRSLVVDAEPRDGVDLILGVVDRLRGERSVGTGRWQWPLGRSRAQVVLSQNGFSLTADSGAQLQVQVQGVSELRLVELPEGQRMIVGRAEAETRMVAALGPAATPMPQLEAAGVQVGSRRLTFAQGSWQLTTPE